ncbi:MAG TPA: hypothetical protein VFY41_02305 [Nitrososphaeraceae archaeon]|nr:hypothetical protein [Nitrososphaeraceae archaeon]
MKLKLYEYPDRLIKTIYLYHGVSSDILICALDYLQLGLIKPIRREGKIVAAKVWQKGKRC